MIIIPFQDGFHTSEEEKVDYAASTPAPAHTVLKQSSCQGDKENKRKASDDKGPKPKMAFMASRQPGQGNFVICEICDGYIKDLEQLRNHMQWIHKVISRNMHHHASHTLIIRSRFTPR